MNLNIYRTSWKDRFLSDGVRINGVSGSANYTGVDSSPRDRIDECGISVHL